MSIKIQNHIETTSQLCKRITLMWVLSHSSRKGNELVDKHAKIASTNNMIHIIDQITHDETKQL